MSAVSIPTPRMRASKRIPASVSWCGCPSQSAAQAGPDAPLRSPGSGPGQSASAPCRAAARPGYWAGGVPRPEAAGCSGAQALRRLAQGGLEAPNAEPSQSAFDPIDQAGALTNQAFALTGWTLSIFLFERRDLGHAAVAALAALPAQEGPLQQRGIQPICFSPPVLARDGDAGWVDDMGFDAVSA